MFLSLLSFIHVMSYFLYERLRILKRPISSQNELEIATTTRCSEY